MVAFLVLSRIGNLVRPQKTSALSSSDKYFLRAVVIVQIPHRERKVCSKKEITAFDYLGGL